MRKIYRIQIEDVHLSKDGTPVTPTNQGCYLEVVGVDDLRINFTRTVVPVIDGSNVIQTFERGSRPLVINVELLPSSVCDLLVDLFNDSMENGTTLTVTGTGGANGDFTEECDIVSFEFADSRSDMLKNARINLVTT